MRQNLHRDSSTHHAPYLGLGNDGRLPNVLCNTLLALTESTEEMSEEAWPFVISVDEARTYPKRVQAMLGFHSISTRGETPGFFWRVDTKPLEEHLDFEP